MKTKFIAFFLIISSVAFGQVTFEKGYYIDNYNRKIDCFIKNYDWQNNPVLFEFKLTENGDAQKAGIAEVKEFVIPGEIKFVRANVKVDRSPTDLSFLTNERNPIWSKEVLFLKVLIEGKATLYSFQDHNLKKYFYSVSDTTMQLICKEYLNRNVDHNKSFSTNNDFRYQLSIDVACKNAVELTTEKVEYEKKSLIRYFKQFNECEGSVLTEYVAVKSQKKNMNAEKRDAFKLKLVPGVNLTSVSFTDVNNSAHVTDFGIKPTFQLGVEAEYILPFNRNKWGILLEPTYQYYNSEIENSFGAGKIHFKSVEFPFGLRYYFFLNKSLKLFVDGLLIPGIAFNFKSSVTIPLGGNSTGTKDIQSTNSAAVGLGIEFKRLSLESRYYTNREILHHYQNYYDHYQRIAAIVGIRIL